MKTWAPTYCVSCFYFPIKEAAASDDGAALCPLYGERYRWDRPATVLYQRDPHVGTRKALIEKLQKDYPTTGEHDAGT